MEVLLCQEETEQDHPVGVAREQEETWVEDEALAGAGRRVHRLELAPVETVFAPVAVLWHPTKQGYPATT